MSANLIPFTTDGGIITSGDILVGGLPASPAPSISGFNSATFTNKVTAGNLFLNTGYIQGGVDTVVTDGINSIAQAPGAQMDLFGFPFSGGGVRGQLTISDVTTPSQANGTWYYQSINTYIYQIYTDSTYSTLVDATGWSAYTGGGTVAITKSVPAANIVVDSNGYLTKFDNTGNLTLPGNLSVVGGTISLTGEGVLRSIDDTVALSSLNTSTGNTNSVYLGTSGGLGFSDTAISGNWLEIFRNGTEPEIRVPVGRGNLNIQTASGNTPYNWTFDDTGNLTIPGSSGGMIKTVANGAIGITAINNGSDNPAQLMSWTVGQTNPNTIISTYANAATILTNVNSTIKSWTFDNAGNLTLPANTFAINYANGTQVSLGGSSSSISNGTSNVTIATSAGNVVTSVGGAAILTTYSGGIKVGGSGILQSPGGASALILNNNGANIPTANITTQLNVTGASGANITANLTAGNISTGGTLTSTGKFGYASGSTVTQPTSRGNGVTINAIAGTILTTSDTIGSNDVDVFYVNNSQVDPTTDIVIAQITSYNPGTYVLVVQPSASPANGFWLSISNYTAFASPTEVITIRFMVIKSPNA